VVRNLGEEKGLKLFRDLAAKNGLSVRRGHSLLAQMVASGEVPFALTVTTSPPTSSKDKARR